MIENLFGGVLIAIDGPNGVGKTTIINELKEKLYNEGYDVQITKEPSKSKLGDFLYEESEKIYGESLACFVAADRYEHLEKEIKPYLKQKKIVLCDRYIMSSLILQCMDGVDTKFVMDINAKIIKPDMQIVLSAPEDIIEQRMKERVKLSRFEKDNKSREEIYYMNKGIEIIKKKDIIVYEYNNSGLLETLVSKIYIDIINLIKGKGE